MTAKIIYRHKKVDIDATLLELKAEVILLHKHKDIDVPKAFNRIMLKIDAIQSTHKNYYRQKHIKVLKIATQKFKVFEVF